MSIRELSNTAGDETAGLAINANGAVAGFAISTSSSFEQNKEHPAPPPSDVMGMKWPAPPTFFSPSEFLHAELVAINSQGWAVGTRRAPAKQAPVLCKIAELTEVPKIDQTAQLTGINDFGQICGYLPTSPPSGGFFLDLAKPVPIQIPTIGLQTVNQACVINNLSEVACVGWDSEGNPSFGVLYRGDQNMLTLKGENISIFGLSNKSVVVGSSSGNPAIWLDRVTTPDPQLLSLTLKGSGTDAARTFGPGGQAMAVNDDGTIVGFLYGPNYHPRDRPQDALAFSYYRGTIIRLNDLVMPTDGDWNLTNATGVNKDGVITGFGYINGRSRGFVLTPLELGTNPFHVREAVSQLFFGVSPLGAKSDPWLSLDRAKQDALISLAIDELAKSLTDPAARRTLRENSLSAAREQIEALLRENNYRHRLPSHDPNKSTNTSLAYREALHSVLSHRAK